MKPILFEIWGFAVASWYFFFALAWLVGYASFLFLLGKTKNVELEREAPTIFIICYLCGWFGARALSIIVEQFEVDSVPKFFAALFSFGPMTFYGGALAAVVVGVSYCVVRKLPLSLGFDAAFPAGIVALGVGRIGCFLNGDDFGIPYQGNTPPWFVFDHLGDGVLRYPVQLEEAAASFAIFGLSVWLVENRYVKNKYTWSPGTIGLIAVLLSALNRFVNEFYRGDARGLFMRTSLSTSQGVALLIAVVCIMRLGLTQFQKR